MIAEEILRRMEEPFRTIAVKVSSGTRISQEEGLALFESGDIAMLGMLAGITRRRLNGYRAYFNRNFHIEPTNICVFNCEFCSYRTPANSPES